MTANEVGEIVRGRGGVLSIYIAEHSNTPRHTFAHAHTLTHGLLLRTTASISTLRSTTPDRDIVCYCARISSQHVLSTCLLSLSGVPLQERRAPVQLAHVGPQRGAHPREPRHLQEVPHAHEEGM